VRFHRNKTDKKKNLMRVFEFREMNSPPTIVKKESDMMSILELHKKTLAALLLAFLMSAILPACSSTDEAAQEDSSGGDCQGTPDEIEACLQDLPL